MAAGNMSPEEVRSTVNKLEGSPSKSTTKSSGSTSTGFKKVKGGDSKKKY